MTVPAPQHALVVDEANAEQFRAWNGDEVEHWVTHIDRYEAASARFDPWLLTAADIGPTDRVLDVGCGAGISSSAAARTAVDGHVVGLDLSAPLLAGEVPGAPVIGEFVPRQDAVVVVRQRSGGRAVAQRTAVS